MQQPACRRLQAAAACMQPACRLPAGFMQPAYDRTQEVAGCSILHAGCSRLHAGCMQPACSLHAACLQPACLSSVALA